MKRFLKTIFNSVTNSAGNKIIVLAYHRVADLKIDPWQLAVNIRNFEEQIKFAVENFQVIDLGEFKTQVSSGDLKANQLLVTFDDAYADNYFNALPILIKYDCPATIFVPSKYIGLDQEFWSDELSHILLKLRALPSHFSIKISNKVFDFNIGYNLATDEDMRKHEAWRIDTPAPTKRCELYLRLWKRMVSLGAQELISVMDLIRKWSNNQYIPDPLNFAMNFDQIKAIQHSKLFSIGNHTHTHIALAAHSKANQQEEIMNCDDLLSQRFQSNTSAIAYPYGSYSKVTKEILTEKNFDIGFSMKSQSVSIKSAHYDLGRFQVLNWGTEHFDLMLKKWATL